MELLRLLLAQPAPFPSLVRANYCSVQSDAPVPSEGRKVQALARVEGEERWLALQLVLSHGGVLGQAACSIVRRRHALWRLRVELGHAAILASARDVRLVLQRRVDSDLVHTLTDLPPTFHRPFLLLASLSPTPSHTPHHTPQMVRRHLPVRPAPHQPFRSKHRAGARAAWGDERTVWVPLGAGKGKTPASGYALLRLRKAQSQRGKRSQPEVSRPPAVAGSMVQELQGSLKLYFLG